METANSAVKKLDVYIAQFTLVDVCKLADLMGVDLDEIFDESGLNS